MSEHAQGLNGAVAAELRAELSRQGLRQADLAKASGVPVVSVQRYLAPNRAMDIEVLDKLTRALGTNAAEIMGRAAAQLARRR